MKKIYLIFIVFIVFLILTKTAYGEDGKVYIDMDRNNIKVGEIVEVRVKVKSITGIYGIKIYLQYDKRFLEPVDEMFTYKELLNQNNFFTAVNHVDENQGLVRFMGTFYGDSKGINKEGTLLNFRFKGKEAGYINIKIAQLELLNKNGNAINCDIEDGTISIKNHSPSKENKENKKENQQDIQIKGKNVENFIIERVVIHKKQNNLKLASGVYKITYRDKGENIQIKEPIEISIKYNKSSNINEEKLGICYFNQERKKWVYLGGKVDKEQGQVKAITNHLSKFGVFENLNLKEFNDCKNHWAKDYIKRLVGMGVLNGYEDNTFKPEKYISRNEFSKMIVLALDLNMEDNNIMFNDYDDIPNWAKSYVACAFENNILQGDDKGNFNGDKLMTRSEMAVALGRVLKETCENQELAYSDANDIPKWAIEKIKLCINKGILNGYKDNTLKPNKPVTRAEAAKMIYKLLWEMKI